MQSRYKKPTRRTNQKGKKQMTKVEEKILQKLQEIQVRLNTIEHRIIRMKLPSAATNEDAALLLNLKTNVLTRIQNSWNDKKPTENRTLAQIFGRKAIPVGGIDVITQMLIEENQIEELTKLTGARLFVPKGALAKFTRQGIEAVRAYGMSATEVFRLRTRAEAAQQATAGAELTPEEEADVERQNAAFLKQLMEQEKIV